MCVKRMKMCIGVVWLLACNGFAQIPDRMIDPIFGMSYNPNRVHFEDAPGRVVQSCSLAGRREPLWLFASYRTEEVEYYIVSGFMKTYPDGPGAANVEADEIGVVVAVDKGKCTHLTADNVLSAVYVAPGHRSGGTFKEILPGFRAESVCDRYGNCPSEINSHTSKRILEGLLANAVIRYSDAFGGREEFLAALSTARGSARPKDIYPPVLEYPAVEQLIEKLIK